MQSLRSYSQNIRTPFVTLVFTLALFTASASARSQATTVDGFDKKIASLAKPVKGWVGLDLLPDGNLLSFDGQNLVALDARTGQIKRTITSLGKGVFGSDVIVSPDGKTAYFCESSNGLIFKVDLATGNKKTLTTLDGNFSLTFSPKDKGAQLWVAADPLFAGVARVYRIDTTSGKSDLIARAKGNAGPILFNKDGDLFLAPGPLQFHKPGLGKILRWSAAKVATAIGPKVLEESAASRFAWGFDNAFDMAMDGEGSFYVCDVTQNKSSVLEINPNGGRFHARNLLRVANETVTFLTFVPGLHPFERFGNDDSRFYVLSTNFFSSRHLVNWFPKRPELSIQPGQSLKPGLPFSYRAKGNPKQSVAIWWIGTKSKTPFTLPIGAFGLRFPELDISLTSPFLFLHTIVDANGIATLSLKAPFTVGFQWTTQLIAGPVKSLPGGTPASKFVSSNPITAKIAR